MGKNKNSRVRMETSRESGFVCASSRVEALLASKESLSFPGSPSFPGFPTPQKISSQTFPFLFGLAANAEIPSCVCCHPWPVSIVTQIPGTGPGPTTTHPSKTAWQRTAFLPSWLRVPRPGTSWGAPGGSAHTQWNDSLRLSSPSLERRNCFLILNTTPSTKHSRWFSLKFQLLPSHSSRTAISKINTRWRAEGCRAARPVQALCRTPAAGPRVLPTPLPTGSHPAF